MKNWVDIAKKYIPDLTPAQESFVKSLQGCKKYGEGTSLLLDHERVPCLCQGCMTVNLFELRKITHANR